jgi:CHAT domain-containing protein
MKRFALLLLTSLLWAGVCSGGTPSDGRGRTSCGEQEARLSAEAGQTSNERVAEALRRRILALDRRRHARASAVGRDLRALGEVVATEGGNVKAEAFFRNALTLDKAPRDRRDLLEDLASLLNQEGRYAQAELFGRAAVRLDRTLTLHGRPSGYAAAHLAESLTGQGKFAEADVQWRAAAATHDPYLEADYGQYLLARGQTAEAVSRLRAAVAAIAGLESEEIDSRARFANARYRRGAAEALALALHRWAKEGGGPAAGDRPGPLFKEAFLAAQTADGDSDGNAFARAGARLGVGDPGLRALIEKREALVDERAALQGRYERLESDAKASDADIEAVDAGLRALHPQIDALNDQLRTLHPGYWALIYPPPATVDELRVGEAAAPSLLHDNEALILMMTPAGSARGLVFAVSREAVGWAEIGASGESLRETVRTLRSQIDPNGYGAAAPAAGHRRLRRPMDRAAAYGLYRALLGDPAIQAVIAPKSVILFAPSGPLNSLPPGLLVTSAPAGGRAMDHDPATLRATHWLLRDKAVAVIPSVVGRRLQSHVQGLSSLPLLAFADPDFSREPALAQMASPSGPEAESLQALAHLPALPGARLEAEALRRVLGGGQESLLMGGRASKVALLHWNSDGRLKQVRVLSFSTHGLVPGDLGLEEPALVLGGDGHGHNGLLTASDAARLRLNADWVILSACNTASPDLSHSDGVSAMARAFFFAGAKALIVSHWQVRDDVASRLIPDVLLRERSGLSRAEAMREASLAILDDPSMKAADPFAWAPFVVIGEPGE